MVKFRAEMSAGSFYMHKNGFTVVQNDTSDLRLIQQMLHEGRSGGTPSAGKTIAMVSKAPTVVAGKAVNPSKPAGSSNGFPVLHSHSYRVSFDGANEQAEIIPEKALQSYNNYFVGKDPSKWATQCKVYSGVTYRNIYDGIDLHYYTDNTGSLKYDLIVHPGADPDKIALKYEGQDKLSIKKNQVEIRTSVGTVRELIPQSYQLTQVEKRDVNCSYYLTADNKIKFKIKNYSPDATLVIDPTLVFCSFTGSHSDNWGYTATYDAAGNFYAGGIAINYPGQSGSLYGATPGAFQSVFQGGDGSEGGDEYNNAGQLIYAYEFDVAIMKFSANGSQKVYATYLGGEGDEQPHSMICDPQGNLIVTGRTSSPDFPPYNAPTTGQGTGFDIFITKFNSTGTALIGSRRIGGSGADGVNYSPKYVNIPGRGTQDLRLNYGDDGRGEVTLDASNNIYVASCTQSNDFYTTPGVFQGSSGGGQDGVLIKTSADVSTILFSSYLGGSAPDAAFSLSLSPANNNIYVGGGTMSTDLKGTTNGTVIYPTNQGGVDGFVSIISNDGSTLIKTTYMGTSGTDMVYGVQFDKEGFPYITGTTTGTWHTANAAFVQAGGKQYISKLQPDLSDWVYSTTFGPAGTTYPNISPTAFLVDRCGNVYVSGWGGGIDPGDGYNNVGTSGLPVTANAIKPSTDGADFYFFVLQKNASAQLYGSFFGQNGGNLGDHVDGGTSRFDKQGVIYQAICANCDGPNGIFPTTPGVWASSNGAVSFGGCNEAAVKIAFNFAGVSAGLKATLQGRGDSLGCIPLFAYLQDTIRNAKSYIWYFGDGTGDTTVNYAVSHTYTQVGTYKVTLIAIDSNSCNVSDTVTMNITARNNPATLNFDFSKDGPCTSMDYIFHNLSTTSIGPPFTDTSFTWNFGDGTGQFPSGIADINHSYTSSGSYNVSLILTDTNYCNAPDTLVKPLFVAQNVKASFETPAAGCAPGYATIINTSIAGQQYYWSFGDGTVDSVDRTPPPHFYPNPGVYTITLKVIDSTTCNIESDTSETITLAGKPTAAFSFSPAPPVANTPDVFTNNSADGAVSFKWLFGDGDTALRTTMDTVIHQYNQTDTFQACLIAFNENGCSDTVCHAVPVLINPLLDVPNAFTPGRFGQNAIIKVVGFGITHMTWKIYNRWGQLVFESIDPNLGWDGTYKGTVQPMDVYAYTLEAEFSNKTRVTKTGDITLIR